ncbi:unnamed protein product [Porites lobata]|uniref:NACHT domain-containing protein n=1 Tax=Porites lobata TaxID=104759 RepID=A0ABN8RRL2_9CNID|nr:unnamed protein product [Porites lobata]
MATAAPSHLASSPEKTNGNKLSRLLIDGGTTVLRNIFDHYHPPVNLASDLNSNYSVLNNLLRKRVLNGHQWDKLFPPSGGVPDSNTFDITLLFLLLTTICGLSPPLTGWYTKPSPSDNSLEANLARVKFFRNELYGHVTSTGVDATSFSSFWQEISITLHSLGLDQAEIDRLKAEHGGEEDYLDAIIDWADSEQDIKSHLKDIHLTQLKLSKTVEDSTLKLEELRQDLSKTQDVVDEAVEIELKGQQEMRAVQSRLEGVCESQSKTSQAVDEIRESIQEVKQEVKSLTQKRNERADEVLRTLVKSEFKGDIDFHAKKFQEGTREWIFKSIRDWLDDRASPHRVMVISGNPGMGKTVISAVVSQRMQIAGRLSGSHFCQHDDSRYRDPRLMLQSLACHLCQAMPNYKDALVEQLSRNLGKDLNNMGVKELFALLFKEPLSTVQDPGRNTLIVIDGLDENEYQGHNELLHVISNHFSMLPVWIRILITTRPERSIIDALRHLEPIELEQKQEENLNDIQTLFEIQLGHQIAEEHKDILLKELVKKSEGLFIYAYFLVDFIQKNVSILTPDQLERVLPSHISSVYLSYFKRLENELCKALNADEETFLRFLCALTAAREPLPVEFIAKILNLEVKSLAAQRKVNKAISCISTLLPVREGRLHFFHKSIKDWLVASSPYEQHDFKVDEKEGHIVLSDLCASELDGIKQKGVHGRQFTNTERYALHHGTQHMLEVKAGQVYQYATDLELIYAKLCIKSTSIIEDLLGLHGDNSSILSDGRVFFVPSLLSLLRKHSYYLLDHPHLFFQCLINEGIPELSSSAAIILESSTPKIPFMKYLDNEEQKGAEQARFCCSHKVVCFDVSPERDHLVCESSDSTIHLWSLQTGSKKWVRPILANKEFFSSDGYPADTAYRRVGRNFLSFYRSVTFHPSGKLVLPGTLKFVYTISGEREKLFPDSDCTFANCAYCKHKNTILTDCPTEPKRLDLWNMENGKILLSIVDIKELQDISSFAISEEGEKVAISDVTGNIFLVDSVNLDFTLIWKSKAVCGLIHFTSDTNFLACGYLRLWLYEDRGFYKAEFFDPPKLLFLPYSSKAETFHLWPSTSSSSLNSCDFMLQNTTRCWVRNVRKVFPRLKAGSYTRLNVETVLVGSPDFNYVAVLNIGQLNGASDSDSSYSYGYEDELKSIALSVKGDTIYSTTSKYDCRTYESKLTVTVLRMSNRKILDTKIFSESVSIVPTGKGVVLFKNGTVAELWNFEMSTFLRPLFVGIEKGNLCSISPDQLAYWYVTTSDESGHEMETLVIKFYDVTGAGSGFSSPLKITFDAGEEVELISVISPNLVLSCTSKVVTFGTTKSADDVTVSLRKNGSVVWKRRTLDEEFFQPHLLCSPKNEFVVTWNTLDGGNGLHILNADNGETLHVFLRDQKAIIDCKFLGDESLIFCSKENFLRLYSVRTGDMLSVLDIGERPFCLGACLYQPLVAVGLSGTRTKFVHVQLSTESKKSLNYQTQVN